MGCLSWGQNLIDALPRSLQRCMHYRVIVHRVITVPHCTCRCYTWCCVWWCCTSKYSLALLLKVLFYMIPSSTFITIHLHASNIGKLPVISLIPSPLTQDIQCKGIYDNICKKCMRWGNTCWVCYEWPEAVTIQRIREIQSWVIYLWLKEI